MPARWAHPRHSRWSLLDCTRRGQDRQERPGNRTPRDLPRRSRENDFDALITISNEIPGIAGQHPTKVDKRKLCKVALHHLPWTYLLSIAVMQKEHRGISDPEHAWILGELVRYLEHPRSGALELEDMGPHWVAVREAVTAGTLRATDKTTPEVAARFDALLRYASLRLGRTLGTDVLPVLSRKELAEPELRAQSLLSSMVATGELGGAIRITSRSRLSTLSLTSERGEPRATQGPSIPAHPGLLVDGPRPAR